MSYTRGPWNVHSSPNGHVYINDVNGAQIARLGGTNMLADDSSVEDNARLIVAAPNMLEALEEILQDACIASEKTDPDEIEEHLETIRMIASRFVLEEE
jgi:hypothetical protein